jgi:uncharacterized protein YkwD
MAAGRHVPDGRGLEANLDNHESRRFDLHTYRRKEHVMIRAMSIPVIAIFLVNPVWADDEPTADEKQLIELVNAERNKADLPPLKAHIKLMKAARDHSANMARKKELAHDLDGKGPGERLNEVGYAHGGWGENCAAGQRTPAEAINCWMNSAPHKANMLGKNYSEVGIGLAKAADGTVYWTQVFGIPSTY